MGTRRQARINSFLIRELSGFIREIKTADLGFVTITRAEISPDLRDARVFVSVLGNETEQQRNLETLAHSCGFLRSRLGKVLGTRVVPRLKFLREEQVASADEMARLIAEARATDPDCGKIPTEDSFANSVDNDDQQNSATDESSAEQAEPIGDFPPPPENLA